MTEEQQEQKKLDFWKMFQIVSPLVSVIAFIIYMQADVTRTIADIESLKEHGENVGKILTAHTTQIAVNSSQISFNKINVGKTEATLIRLEEKIDILLKAQAR